MKTDGIALMDVISAACENSDGIALMDVISAASCGCVGFKTVKHQHQQ